MKFFELLKAAFHIVHARVESGFLQLGIRKFDPIRFPPYAFSERGRGVELEPAVPVVIEPEVAPHFGKIAEIRSHHMRPCFHKNLGDARFEIPQETPRRGFLPLGGPYVCIIPRFYSGLYAYYLSVSVFDLFGIYGHRRDFYVPKPGETETYL